MSLFDSFRESSDIFEKNGEIVPRISEGAQYKFDQLMGDERLQSKSGLKDGFSMQKSYTQNVVEKFEKLFMMNPFLEPETDEGIINDCIESAYMESENEEIFIDILEDDYKLSRNGNEWTEGVAKTDDNGKVYLKDDELEPYTIYELNGNTYTTDDKSRIIRCEAQPERSPENPRDINAQLKVGGENRRLSDQGGHIVGRDLNGDAGIGNLVAMDSRINQSDYKCMENNIKNILDEGKEVVTKTEMTYTGDSKRPDRITVTITVEAKDTVIVFDNNLDGALDSKVTEKSLSAKAFLGEHSDAHVSSIKEEYDEKGNLVNTTARITYVDESGNTYRKPVQY